MGKILILLFTGLFVSVGIDILSYYSFGKNLVYFSALYIGYIFGVAVSKSYIQGKMK